MIDKDAARAIAQAKVDELNKAYGSDVVRTSSLSDKIRLSRFGLFHPLYNLKLLIERLHFPDSSVVIIDSATLEEDFGWVFFYQSKRYLDTGNVSWMLVGNAPLIVDRCDGSIHVTGTYHRVDYFIDLYRQTRKLKF